MSERDVFTSGDRLWTVDDDGRAHEWRVLRDGTLLDLDVETEVES